MIEELEELKEIFINSCELDLPIKNLDRPLELIDKLSNQVQAGVMQKIAELIKVYDEKRIDLLHWRRSGIIPGGIEQTKLIEGFIQDLKELSNFSA